MQWSHRTVRIVRRSVAGALVAALVAFLTVTVIQDRRDAARYSSAHAAYLAGRCADAVADYDVLLSNSRLVDTTHSINKARVQRRECVDLLEVDALRATDAPAALVGYETFLADWPDTGLRDVVLARASSLVDERGAAVVASAASCPRLSTMVEASLMVEATAMAIRVECAALYRDAGRAAEAYAAALAVLRSSASSQAMLDRAAAMVAADAQACGDFDEVRTLAKLDQHSALLVSTLQLCITAATADGNAADLAKYELALISAAPDDPAAATARAALLAVPESCAVVAAAQADPAVVAQSEFLANFVFRCAQVAEFIGAHGDAVDRYQWFLDHAPLDPRVTTARDGLARALINQATGAGAGALPSPQSTGRSGTTAARVTIYNDSPETLRLVLSGPEARIEFIPASPTSSNYSGIGPTKCRTDVPSIELQLQPGEYKALVEATSGNVSDFVGTWTMARGAAYRSCFFIVTTFG